MIPVKIAIKKIRAGIHDWQGVNYDNDEIISVLNAGLRIIRRTITEIQPELLMETTTGILQAGEDEIKLKRHPLMIVEMTAGDKILSVIEGYTNKKIWHNREKIYDNKRKIYSKYEIKTFEEHKLKETNIQHVGIRNKTGRPREFYRTGWKSLKISPIPEKETAFTIKIVDDIEEMRYEDHIPLIAEFDDFLIEYAVMRLSIDNEYDISQEQAIIGSIQQQIMNMLAPPPVSVQVRGYW